MKKSTCDTTVEGLCGCSCHHTATNAMTLQCVWPIIDDTLTRAELIDEAKQLLSQTAADASCEIVGPPIWETAFAEDIPGWEHAPAGSSVLIAHTPVMIAADVDHHRMLAALAADLIGDTASDWRDADEALQPGHQADKQLRLMAIALGARRGLSDAQLAQRLGITSRTVLRYRSAHNIAAADLGTAA